MAEGDYLGETVEWEDLIRLLDALGYTYHASGDALYDRTDRIDLDTPGGLWAVITEVVGEDGEPLGWTIEIGSEGEHEAGNQRPYTVESIADLIDLIDAN